MKARKLLVLGGIAVLSSMVLLVREIRHDHDPVATAPVAPRATAHFHVVMPAGVLEAPDPTVQVAGTPEIPEVAIVPLATMPASAPVHPETMPAPKP